MRRWQWNPEEESKSEKNQRFVWIFFSITCAGLSLAFLNGGSGWGAFIFAIGALMCWVMQKQKFSNAEDNKWRSLGASESEVSLRRNQRYLEDELSSAESTPRNSSLSVEERLRAQIKIEGTKQRLQSVRYQLNR